VGQKPPKDPDALYRIRTAVTEGRYIETFHGIERLNERHVNRLEIKYVLLNGKRDEIRDEFSKEHNTWAYRIEGPTLDRDKRLRIIVALKSDPLMGDVARIVSVIDITKRGRDEDR